jgi:PIN domain nuclease of toxin-antitoxin system
LRFLLDTHLIVWMSGPADRLPRGARNVIEDKANLLVFSALSILEVTIKAGLARPDFRVDPTAFRNNLVANDLEELSFTSDHPLAVQRLPPLHRDPFDRALVAQAICENLTLMTADKRVAAYPGRIMLV